MAEPTARIPDEYRADAETLWEYHQMHHELRPTDVGIGLGSHDPSVAMVAVDLYKQAMFPLIVFTGANVPTTVDRFPRGEAVHYREYALEHGVPDEAVLIETTATNTGQNIEFNPIGDSKRVVDMLVGDTQRIQIYAEQGFALPQEVPPPVSRAYDRLVRAGFDSRLL